MSRYIYLNHYYDRFELLVDGSCILRITKLFSDSGIHRQIEFAELPNGLKEEALRLMDKLDYEI